VRNKFFAGLTTKIASSQTTFNSMNSLLPGIPCPSSTSFRHSFVAAAAGLAIFAASSNAQTLPGGSRWLGLTDSTRIGARVDGVPDGGAADIVANREFDAIQRQWYPNWGGWTGQGTYGLTDFNAWVNWASSKGKPIYMHMFVGPSFYLPDWFKNASWSNAQMDTLLRDLIRDVIQSNGNNTKVTCWNLVNECLSDSNGAYRPDSESKFNQLGWEADASGLSGLNFVNTYHPIYIRSAFQYARQYTNAKLELRDYGIELDPNSAKTRAFYQLAAHLLGKGAPLDAVGVQCHLGTDSYNWERFKEVVKKFKGLGLEVYITELDMGRKTGLDFETQRIAYYEQIRAARESGVEAIFTWGMADYRQGTWRENDQPLPFDSNYNAKPAYYGVQQALDQTRKFVVRARGSSGGERLELRVDNQTVDYWFLSREWSDYCYSSYSGSHNIKLAFVNDGNLYGRDKNVQIDYIKVNGATRQAESQATNTGSGRGSSEWMYWNGHIDFGTVAGSAAPLPNGTYRITPRHALYQSLDVSGVSSASGANVHTWSYGGGSNQEWTITHTGSGWYEIKARHSGLALDVNSSGTANGTNVQQWPDNDTAAQRWRLDAAGNGWYRITPQVAQDKCLDVSNASSNDGANVQIYQYGRAGNQQWKLERLQ
jgi:endo-1,4-beta-xylanase